MSDSHVQSNGAAYRAITVGGDNGNNSGNGSTSCARRCTNILLVAILIVASVVLVFVIRNNNNGQSVNNDSAGTIIPNLGNEKTIIKQYYSGGQYSRDLDDVTGVWTDHFHNQLPLSGDKIKNTVVFDLDETVLWNMQVIFDSDFGFIAKEWDPWVQSANATCIAQTCALYQYLVKNNYNIVFITGRHEHQREATELNLKRVGLTTYDTLILRSSDEDKLTATQYKSGHRRRLTEEKGYVFVGCAGDQLSDCNGGFAGYAMKVPNYAYFIA
jgi:hypothetical protein